MQDNEFIETSGQEDQDQNLDEKTMTQKEVEEGTFEDEVVESFTLEEDIKIPKDRVAVLIGSGGETKKLVESKTNCRINVHSEDGLVEIQGSDAIDLFDCKDIVLAIGRGFNPKIALKLLDDEFSLDIIRLRDIIGKNQNQLERIRSRVIGREGKVRRELQRLTDCDIAVYGKTISILGDSLNVATCHRAIEMLLQGAMHKTVYTFLEKENEKEQAAYDQVKLMD